MTKKKLLLAVMCIVCLICISFCACGSSSSSDGEGTSSSSDVVKIDVGDAIETDNFKMTIDSVEFVDEYTIQVNDCTTDTFHSSAGYKMLLVKGVLENKTESEISIASFRVVITVNGKSCDNRLYIEENLSSNATVPANSEVHYFIPYDVSEPQIEEKDTVTITISFRDDMSAITPDYTEDITNVYEIDYKYK